MYPFVLYWNIIHLVLVNPAKMLHLNTSQKNKVLLILMLNSFLNNIKYFKYYQYLIHFLDIWLKHRTWTTPTILTFWPEHSFWNNILRAWGCVVLDQSATFNTFEWERWKLYLNKMNIGKTQKSLQNHLPK
jgi:hypothetical protein